MAKTLVIFDIDGTLLYSNRVDSISFAETFVKIYKKPLPGIDWRKYPHVTDHTIFKTSIKHHFDREPSDDEISEFQNHFVDLLKYKRKKTPQQFREIPNAKNTIHQLTEHQDFITGIATGGWEKPATVKLHHIGIDTKKLIMSFADGKNTREEIVTEVIDNANKKYPEIKKIVYVGDAVWDVKTTKNLNLGFIGIGFQGSDEEIRNAGAKTIIKDYSDFNYFLKKVEKAEPPI